MVGGVTYEFSFVGALVAEDRCVHFRGAWALISCTVALFSNLRHLSGEHRIAVFFVD